MVTHTTTAPPLYPLGIPTSRSMLEFTHAPPPSPFSTGLEGVPLLEIMGEIRFDGLGRGSQVLFVLEGGPPKSVPMEFSESPGSIFPRRVRKSGVRPDDVS